ncbi:MAG: hypothetical protein ING56_05715 [Rhodocyclaceae bacterium]|jgi:hypothetical protein|nr:hypothetical protein [Rhodocyclaceae bacterium]MCA3026031.1 hypothetical protein [Rhodocyclaceae bacterium]MCA3031419.1 hypothetical protein [Rhodocyclaceae bacterium]
MPTPQLLLTCGGGIMILPNMPLVDRADGGHLGVNRPREVWERVELSANELSHWGFLVAATVQVSLRALRNILRSSMAYPFIKRAGRFNQTQRYNE